MTAFERQHLPASRVRPKLALSAMAAAVVAWSIGPAQAVTYSIVNIVDTLNPTFTQALGINDTCTIVGYGDMTTFNGFQLVLPPVPANFTRQNVPGADGGTQVVGVSAAGRTVGFSITGGVTNGFAHTGSTFTTVDQPGTAFNQLLGINASGTVAAGYSSTDPAGATLQKALTVAGGPSFLSPVFTNIDALLVSKFGPNFNSQATGVNNAGTVVGLYLPTAATSVGFLDLGRVISMIDPFGSTFTQALGINNNGDEIVGFEVDAMGFQHGYVDINGTPSVFDPPGRSTPRSMASTTWARSSAFSPMLTTTLSALSPPPRRPPRSPGHWRSLPADCSASVWHVAGAKPRRDTNSGASLTRHGALIEYRPLNF
jgi:hypothetical protein